MVSQLRSRINRRKNPRSLKQRRKHTNSDRESAHDPNPSLDKQLNYRKHEYHDQFEPSRKRSGSKPIRNLHPTRCDKGRIVQLQCPLQCGSVYSNILLSRLRRSTHHRHSSSIGLTKQPPSNHSGNHWTGGRDRHPPVLPVPEETTDGARALFKGQASRWKGCKAKSRIFKLEILNLKLAPFLTDSV